jgi:(1->4)-alpha-D-glucan 1-alpha-D-glucosylmutase
MRGENVVVIALRWYLKLGGNLGPTTVQIPEGTWNNLFTSETFAGGRLRAQNLFMRFPVALLTRNGE